MTIDGVTTTYTYDANGQLLSESRSGYSASYTYDANGNRASRTVNGVTETYNVDSGDKLTQVSVSGVPTKTFGYDGAGRTTSIQTSAGTTSFTYDFESRVTGITYPNSSTNSFTYNGLDTRVGKTDSTGTATFRRMGAGVTAPVLGDGSASFTPGLSERRGSTTSFYGADYLGTNSALYSSSETVSATRQYDAFGNLVASSGSSANPFGFAGNWGYQNDSDSGLKLLGHRYYDASTGRFLTRDPIKDGRNWYAYCGNDPIGAVDPEGLEDIVPPPISGYTKHGIDRAIGSGTPIRQGVSPKAILQAVREGTVTVQETIKGPVYKFVGRSATVVLNDSGKVITTYPINSGGIRGSGGALGGVMIVIAGSDALFQGVHTVAMYRARIKSELDALYEDDDLDPQPAIWPETLSYTLCSLQRL